MARKRQVKIDIIEGDTSGRDQIRGTAEDADRLTGSLETVGRVGGAALVALGTAAGALTALSIREAIGYGDAMREVYTLMPGISQEAMDAMSDQVKDFAGEFGVLPNDVIPALYDSISAGVPADNVFDFLAVAQMAAKGGVTELGVAVDGISSVVNAYGDDVLGAAEASDLMFTAVRLGKTTFDELSASLFQVAPAAATLGVDFANVTAALATLTSQGTPTTVATTQIRQALVELGQEGSKAAQAFEGAAGTTFPEFIASGEDLGQVVRLMADAAAEGETSILNLFGSVEAGQAFAALAGDVDGFVENLAEMEAAAGATEAAFAQMDQGASAAFDRIRARLTVAAIEFGEVLLPAVEQGLDFIAEEFVPAVEGFVAAYEEGGIGGAIGFVTEALKEETPKIAAALWEIGGEFVNWIGPRIPEALEDAGEFIGDIAAWLIDVGLPELGEALLELGEEFVNWIGPQVGPFLDELGAFVDSGLTWLLDEGIPQAAEALAEFGVEFWKWVGPMIPPLLEELNGLIFDVAEWIVTDASPEIALALVAWTDEFTEWVTFDLIPDLVAKLPEITSAVAAWVWEEGTGDMADALGDLFDEFMEWLTDGAPREIAQAAVGMFDGIADEFAKTIKGLPGGVVDDVVQGAKDLVPGGGFDLPGVDDIPKWLRPWEYHTGGTYTNAHGGAGLALLNHGETVSTEGQAGASSGDLTLIIELGDETVTRKIERTSERRPIRVRLA